MAYYNEYSTSKSRKNHSDRFKYMKLMTQILLPLSVFSLLLSHSSLVPLLINSYDYFVSNLSFKFKVFTYTTERNCIFLLCNGILVLIIQSSGLIRTITPSTKTARIDDHHLDEKHDENARFEESKKKGVGKVEILDVAAEVEENFENCEDEVEKWDEEEDDGGIDREELKKKFEDFIKKTKREIQGL